MLEDVVDDDEIEGGLIRRALHDAMATCGHRALLRTRLDFPCLPAILLQHVKPGAEAAAEVKRPRQAPRRRQVRRQEIALAGISGCLSAILRLNAASAFWGAVEPPSMRASAPVVRVALGNR